MTVRIVEVILKNRLSSIELEITSWRIHDGVVIFIDSRKDEATVFPITSIVCFHEKVKKGE